MSQGFFSFRYAYCQDLGCGFVEWSLKGSLRADLLV